MEGNEEQLERVCSVTVFLSIASIIASGAVYANITMEIEFAVAEYIQFSQEMSVSSSH